MHNSESIYRKAFQLSDSTGKRLTSDYERVYETEIGSSILQTTTGFHRHSAHGAGPVPPPPQTAFSPLLQVEKVAKHTGN